MYKQPNHSYASTDSLRRLSSNNPFRQHQAQASYEPPKLSNLSSLSLHSGERPSSFGDWVEKNKQLLDNSSDEEQPFRPVNMGLKYSPLSREDLGKPVFPPKPHRADSDSSVNYHNVRMSSNNPFAAALNEPDSYVHHRDPPPPPRSSSQGGTPPARPPKPDALAPPSYEEAAGPDAARRDYPREKASSSSSSSRQRRSHSHSEASRPHRSSREKGSSSRHRSGHKSSKNKSPKKPEPVKAKNLDTIDKLDVTGFFGGGFHHDGPFDACTPHRNKNVKSAPVKAFPPDGPNSSIKGYGGTDKNQQINLAFGQFEDQNEIVGRKTSIKYKPKDTTVTKTYETEEPPQIRTPADISSNPSIVNFASNLKAEPVHGSTTAGLGSSTFIDGAPAPKSSETEYLNVSNGGLGRKKSLVQRLRKNSHSENSTRRNSNDSSLTSPEPTRRGSLNNVESSDELTPPSGGAGSSLLRRVKSLKVRR
ncbi:Pal1-domain-containing protein [Suhomyces tanzawaensis NRRL Y-17324]